MKQMQTPLSTRITVELAAWLQGYAKETGKSQAAIVQEALEALRAKAQGDK